MSETAGPLSRAGLRTGAVAWIVGVGVAVMLVALFSNLGRDPVRLVSSGVVFYYTVHLWPMVLVSPEIGASAAIFSPLAMLLLFWAGLRTAVRTNAGSVREGVLRGASVLEGYLALAILSLPAFLVVVEASPLADPLVTAAMIGTTGVAFPVIFGGLGGWIAGR